MFHIESICSKQEHHMKKVQSKGEEGTIILKKDIIQRRPEKNACNPIIKWQESPEKTQCAPLSIQLSTISQGRPIYIIFM